MAPRTQTHKTDSARAREALRRLDALPAPPAVAAKVIAWVMDKDPSIAALCSIVNADPSLAMRVLKLANAKVYGVQGRALHIEHAAVMLGVSALKQCLLGVCIRDTLIGDKKLDDPLLNALWMHSLATALCAQALAEKLLPEQPDLAFSCGLIHDCGKIGLLQALGSEYEALLEEAPRVGTPFHVRESEALGLDHAAAGRVLATSWGLPKVLSDAVSLHHQPEDILTEVDAHGGILALVSLANLLAHELLGEPLSRAETSRRNYLLAHAGLSESEAAALQRAASRGFAERRELLPEDDGDAVSQFCQALQRAGRTLGQTNAALIQSREEVQRAGELFKAVSQAGPRLALAEDQDVLFRLSQSALSEAFGATQGCLFALDPELAQARGLLWSEAGVTPFAWPLDAASGRITPPEALAASGLLAKDSDGPEKAFAAALLAFPDRVPPGAALTELAFLPSYFRSLLIVPLIAGCRHFGELIVGPADEGSGVPVEVWRHGLEQFSGVVASALHRLSAKAGLEAGAERLNAAMRRMKQMHQELLRAERLAAVGQLAAGAAHEINNPLAILYARLQLLGFKAQDPTMKAALGQMEEQVGRISEILEQLMDFARPVTPQLGAVSLNRLVVKTMAMMSGNFEKENITARLDLAPEEPLAWGDEKLLEQVLVNLLLNAEQALQESGGTVSARTLVPRPGTTALIEVEDTGSGVAAEHLRRVFDPFFTTKEGRGVGLGLSTCQAIVQNHHGDIRVVSAPGKGALFRVSLPLAPGNIAAEATAETDA